MMKTSLDLGGLARVEKRLAKLGTVTMAQMEPMLIELQKVLVEDNRIGVLKGIDKDDQAAPPLKYRNGKGRSTNPRKAGFGKATGKHNPNPVDGKYRSATGPRLAPFRTKSRVITNYHTQRGMDGSGFFVEGAWLDVLSKDGKPFLKYHFFASNPARKYNLVGLRKWGRDEAIKVVRKHVSLLLKP